MIYRFCCESHGVRTASDLSGCTSPASCGNLNDISRRKIFLSVF